MEEFHKRENTSPFLRHVWSEAMEVWFAEKSLNIQLSPTLLPSDIRQVVIQQNKMGGGKFSTVVLLWHGHRCKRILQHDKYTGPTRTRKINRRKREAMAEKV
jgi:hypothetical protein